MKLRPRQEVKDMNDRNTDHLSLYTVSGPFEEESIYPLSDKEF